MRYSENIDYLLASVIYLGTHTFWWARSPHSMANELQLEEKRLEEVFDAFPGLFRKSVRKAKDTGQHFYSLQARYAQKEGGDVSDPDQESYVSPLSPDKLQVLINFIIKMAEEEHKLDDQAIKRDEQRQTRSISLRNSYIAIGAAIISAVAAILCSHIQALIRWADFQVKFL